MKGLLSSHLIIGFFLYFHQFVNFIILFMVMWCPIFSHLLTNAGSMLLWKFFVALSRWIPLNSDIKYHDFRSQMKPRKCQDNPTELADLFEVNHYHFIDVRCVIFTYNNEFKHDLLLLSIVAYIIAHVNFPFFYCFVPKRIQCVFHLYFIGFCFTRKVENALTFLLDTYFFITQIFSFYRGELFFKISAVCRISNNNFTYNHKSNPFYDLNNHCYCFTLSI